MNTKPEMSSTKHEKSVLPFFLWTIVLIIPFWALGALTGIQLAPGLPVAALGVFCPVIAAVIMAYRADKKAGVSALLKRSLDFHRIQVKRWYLPILLLMPAVSVLSFWTLRLTGISVPDSQIAILPAIVLCLATLLGALGEELGWSGYAIEPMQERWGALTASLILGVFWALYHYIGLVEAHRSLVWIAWWSLCTISTRVIMVWLFNNTGKSVFGMALFHMTINVIWLLFPIGGSYYDYRVTGLIMAAVAAIVTILWGPSTLARYPLGRFSKQSTDAKVDQTVVGG